MNPDGLHITRHAIERFMARWPHTIKPECWQTALRRVLESATEETPDAIALRLLDNNLLPAKYYVADGWRFVFDEHGHRLLTCERIIFKRLWQRKTTEKDRRRKRLERRQR